MVTFSNILVYVTKSYIKEALLNLWGLTDDLLAAEVRKKIKSWESAHSRWVKQAEEDFNFPAGNQWDVQDLQKLEDEKRPVITFNRCNVILSAILGMEANQRQEVRFNPRDNSDLSQAEAYTKTAEWAREYAEISQEEAQSFEDMLTCGVGASETFIDYEQDLDGKTMQEAFSPLEARWDPTAKKRNLKDRQWCAREQKMRLDEIIEKFGAQEMDTDEPTPEVTASLLTENVKDPYGEETRDVDDTESSGIPVYQFQWYECVDVWRIKNPTDGKIVQATPEEYNKNKDFIAANGIPAIKQKVRKYYRIWCTSKHVYKREELPSQTGFTINFITGKRDLINKSWFGIIRLIKDPQRWANKFFSTFLDIIDSNAKGGVMAETGAVEDVRKFEEEWSKPDSVTWLAPGALANGKVQPKPVAQYPQAIDRLLTFSIQSIHDVSGVNLELLGAVDRAEIGVVVDSRKRSAYTILAPFFDSLKAYRTTNAMILMEFISKFIPENKIAEILPPELQQLAPTIKQIDLQRVNIIVTESPQSDNNRYIAWQFISQVLPQILQAQPGMPIPPSMLDYSPLPAGLIFEWKAMIKQQEQSPQKEQQQQFAEMMKQMEAALRRAEVATKEAEAFKKQQEGIKVQAETEQLQKETAMGMNVYGAY